MKRLLYFLPAVLLYGLIFFVSSRSLPLTIPGRWLDKIPHALVFAALGLLIAFGFFHSTRRSSRLNFALTFLIGTFLGALDEFHQKFVKGRSSNPRDAAADVLGVVLGIALYWNYLRRKSRALAAKPLPGTASATSSEKQKPPSGSSRT
jgi:VanZ family protein